MALVQAVEPVALVVIILLAGMNVVDKIYSGYAGGPPRGNGPDQGRIQNEAMRTCRRASRNSTDSAA